MQIFVYTVDPRGPLFTSLRESHVFQQPSIVNTHYFLLSQVYLSPLSGVRCHVQTIRESVERPFETSLLTGSLLKNKPTFTGPGLEGREGTGAVPISNRSPFGSLVPESSRTFIINNPQQLIDVRNFYLSFNNFICNSLYTVDRVQLPTRLYIIHKCMYTILIYIHTCVIRYIQISFLTNIITGSIESELS